ncbi:MAG: hypothetical protein ABFS43_06080 [Thermodesulfobacteriota bacterium]
MEKTSLKIIYRLLMGVSAILLLAVFYLGYRVIDISNENRALQNGKHTYLEKRLSNLERRIEALAARIETSAQDTLSRESGASPKPSVKKTSGNLGATVENNSNELKKLKEIMASTGLDRLAEGEDIDPEILSSLYSEYAEQNRVSMYHRSMLERNESNHQQDKDLFDAYLDELYNRARIRRGTSTDSEDREAAFAEMLDKYPDAYATAMVIAERAFASMWSRDQAGVENYYAMLQERDSDIANTVVTDRGIEALPNIELYLARQYLRNGREEEAGILMESLESNHADSLVFSGRSGRGRRWMTVSEALERISSTR